MFGADLSKVNTVLAPGTSVAQGLFIEMFMTAQLVFVILMLAAEKSKDTFIAPIGIGLALFIAELTGRSGLKQTGMSDAYNNSRRLLYGRISESGAQFWVCGRREKLPWLSLDLLDWTGPGCSACCNVLSFCQVGTL